MRAVFAERSSGPLSPSAPPPPPTHPRHIAPLSQRAWPWTPVVLRLRFMEHPHPPHTTLHLCLTVECITSGLHLSVF